MKLGICIIVKDEGRYLAEWMAFHFLQGFTRFYIYDNESKDNTREVIFDTTKKLGCFTMVHDWPGVARQPAACRHFIKVHKKEVDWVAFIDIDEFLFSPTGESVMNVIEGFSFKRGVSAVAAKWVLYGTSHEQFYRPKPVLERFTMREDKVDKHCKSICRTEHLITTSNNVHTFKVSGDVVNESGKVLPQHYALTDFGSADYLRINHYHTKSREEYKGKCSRFRADIPVNKDFDTNLPVHDKNEVVDTYLRDTYLPKIQELLSSTDEAPVES